jgi:hypothetical protein
MNAKNLLVSGIVGSIAYFLLGWLFYGLLFTNIYPSGGEENLLFIYLGGLTVCLLLAYIFLQWAHISQLASGIRAGAILGLFIGLMMNFFMYSNMTPDYGNMIIDTAITIIMLAFCGGLIAFVIGKMK